MMQRQDLKIKNTSARSKVFARLIEKITFEARLDEQRRIGQELHDNICQQLAGAALLSKSLAQRLLSKKPGEAAMAAEIAELLNLAAHQTRDLSRTLSPVDLALEDLIPTLQKFTTQIHHIYNISCVFDGEKVSRLSCLPHPSAATHLYRIVQEAVNNAIRHGKADRIMIALATGKHRAVLMIRDNGHGLSTDAFKKEGLGLRSMRSRAKMIGAELKVYRDPKGETIVNCSIPYDITNKSTNNRRLLC